MIDIKKIHEVTTDSLITEFAEFVISKSDGKEYINYKTLNVMEVPNLVQNFFIFDYRNGIEDGMLIHLSGTFLDTFFGNNITGKFAEDIYKGGDSGKLIIGLYREAFLKKKTAFACREIEFDVGYQKFRHAESLLFQSSVDGETLDFGFGLASYTEKISDSEDKYLLLD